MPTNRTSLLCAALVALVPAALHAAPPAYVAIELEARSNLLANDDSGWNLPAGTSFNSISANLDDDDEVAFTAGVVPVDGDLSRSGAGVWFGAH
ncbi:MAG TPA: hypothetical protein VGC30_11110, partial [Dokdonella sp.]